MTAVPGSPRSVIKDIQGRSEASGLRVVGHHNLAGHGDGMQVTKRGDLVYVAHVGTSPVALSILDVSDPSAPRMIRQLLHPPGTHRHKVQIAGDVLIQNSEVPYFAVPDDQEPLTGLAVYDIREPTDPREVGFYPVEPPGVHRIWFTEGTHAHIAAALPGVRDRGYHIVDLAEPQAPALVGAWWIPGSRAGDESAWPRHGHGGRFKVHGVIPSNDRAYVACTDSGMAILDISDPSVPHLISHLSWSPPYGGYVHTCLPLPARGLVIATCEPFREDPPESDKRIWVVDVREEEFPVTIATFPVPTPGPAMPWSSYRGRPGQFGPHNLHENQPGAFQSDTTIFATYYNAGVRVYDISDPHRPEEIAHFVPPPPEGQEAPQLNDLFVASDGLVYVTDRLTGGLYVLEYTAEHT